VSEPQPSHQFDPKGNSSWLSQEAVWFRRLQ
jgi:hypothetical protein